MDGLYASRFSGNGKARTRSFGSFAPQDAFEIAFEGVEKGEPLGCGIQSFLLVDEQLLSAPFHQRSQAFTHAPANVPENLQSFRPGHQESNTVVAHNTDSFRETVEGLEIEAGGVETLKLFFWKH